MALFRIAARRGGWIALWGCALLAACASRPLPPEPPPRVAAPLPPVAPVPASPPVAPPPAVPASPPAKPAVAVAPTFVETAAVAARFPDPAVAYATPAFAPGHDGFTSNAELSAAMRQLVHDGSPGTTTVRLVALGLSQLGEPLEALHFTRDPDPAAALPVHAPRPVVLLIGQQHGDEPAGSEALLLIAQELARGKLQSVLDRVDVVVMPRANPDGAAVGRRVTANGVDLNRDHLLLKTPEAQAQAQLVREFSPAVVVDAHEYSADGPYPQKFGALQRHDALLQYAMTANLPEFITKAAEEWFRKPLLAELKREGLTTEWYYTTASATPADLLDNKLTMGSVRPDTARNVNGLKNAVSFLVETRGIGLGRVHLKRRVYTHVTAVTSLLGSAAARAADLAKLRQFVAADVSAKACVGEAVVLAEPVTSEYSLRMLDPVTGADKTVNVTWDSSLVLAPRKVRSRPCGYWLDAQQVDAVGKLRALGVQVQRIEEPGVARGESYRETASSGTADAGGTARVAVDTIPALIDVASGSYYVGLDQPLANLVLAAMEPDTPDSYFANGTITGVAAEARVLARPEVRLSVLP